MSFFPQMRLFRRRSTAFSLVEVVLAIGVVSTALVVVVGLFGGMLRSSSANTDRREFTEAVDSLASSLSDTNFTTFNGLLEWLAQNKKLVYVTYRADSSGVPDPSGALVMGRWIDTQRESASPYEASRQGRWLRASLQLSPSNPGGPVTPPYTRASVFVLAEIDIIPSPGQTNSTSSRLQTTMAIRR